MKKILALLLASAMLVSATALIIGAEVDEETTAVEETTEDTTAVEETTTELGDVTAEETTGEPVDPPAQPAKPIAPTLLNEFTATGLVQNQNSPNTKGTLNNGVIELRPDGDAWKNETEGAWVDATVKIDISWHIREGGRAGKYNAEKLVLTKNMKYLVVKVKQQDNFAEDIGLEMAYYSADPKTPRQEAPYYVYSLTTIQGEDGFSYLVFDVGASDDFSDCWVGQMLTGVQLLWASCPAANAETAYMDIYEINILGTEEEVAAYMGKDEVEWRTEPEVTKKPADDDEEEEEETTSAAPVEDTTAAPAAAGCKGVIASASVLGVVALAAGAVIFKKKD